MNLDVVLEGKALINGEITYAEIGISEGRIAVVGKAVHGGDKRIDMGGSKIILPGFVDPHVHFRDPGLTDKEDFSSGTLSALHGGVTCVLDMPNTKPPVCDVRTMMEKKSAVKRKAYVDYGLFAAVTPKCNAALLAPISAGFKIFMGSTTGNILMNDDAEMLSAMQSIAKTGKRTSVHAEDERFIHKGAETSTRDHLRNRPAEAERNAIRRLARFKGMRMNICHCTTAETLASAAELGFTTEVTLHHLLFDIDKNTNAYYKVNPPIREPAARDALYKAFLDGKAVMFGTDHAPHTQADKTQDFDSAPSGIPGIETSMPIVMNMVRKNQLSVEKASAMGSRAPADAFGMKKGRIEAGFDADLSVFDLHKVSEIDEKRLHSKAGYSPYRGWEAVFPDTVLLRGQIQLQGGEFCGDRLGEDICG